MDQMELVKLRASLQNTSIDMHRELSEKELRALAEQEQRERMLAMIRRAGIPPRYHEANLKGCQKYSGMEGKSSALEAGKVWSNHQEVTQRGRVRKCLLLSGQVGTGKTWLATAALKHLMWNNQDLKPLWVKARTFIREVQSGYKDGNADVVLARYQKADVLLIDDVGDMDIQEQSTDQHRLFYELLDDRNDWLRPTIITTNLSPSELRAFFKERTYARIEEMCAIIPMTGDNLREVEL